MQVEVCFFVKKQQKTFVNLVLLGLCVPFSAYAAPPPASAYAELPTAANARMSPDGKSVAYIDGQDNSLIVTISQIDSNKILPIPTGAWSPNWIDWKDNQTLLTSMRQTALTDGVPIPTDQLMAFAADGSKGYAMRARAQNDIDPTSMAGQHEVTNLFDLDISDLPDQPGQVLIELADQTFDYPSVYQADIWDDISPSYSRHGRDSAGGYSVTL